MNTIVDILQMDEVYHCYFEWNKLPKFHKDNLSALNLKNCDPDDNVNIVLLILAAKTYWFYDLTIAGDSYGVLYGVSQQEPLLVIEKGEYSYETNLSKTFLKKFETWYTHE